MQNDGDSSDATPCYEVPSVLTRVPTCFGAVGCGPMLQLSHDNCVVTYVGPGQTDAQAASVRTDMPIPTTNGGLGGFYFEADILNAGESGYIGIGLTRRGVRLNCLPGWHFGSYGYHGDDGKFFAGDGIGQAYGPQFTEGDCVGCYFSAFSNFVLWTLNGNFIGEPKRIGGGGQESPEYFPVVGLRTPGESVRLNCGTDDNFKHMGSLFGQRNKLFSSS